MLSRGHLLEMAQVLRKKVGEEEEKGGGTERGRGRRMRKRKERGENLE